MICAPLYVTFYCHCWIDWLPHEHGDRHLHWGQRLCLSWEPFASQGLTCAGLCRYSSDRLSEFNGGFLWGGNFIYCFSMLCCFSLAHGHVRERDPGTSGVFSLEVAWSVWLTHFHVLQNFYGSLTAGWGKWQLREQAYCLRSPSL